MVISANDCAMSLATGVRPAATRDAAEVRRGCATGGGWTREGHQKVARARAHLGGQREVRGWPGFAGMEPEAAVGARVGAGLVLRLANKLAATLALLHGSLRVQRTHARGHLVTGASPATSPCGGASRLR